MNILYPFEWAVAWILVRIHDVVSLVLPQDSGWSWVIGIIGLTVIIRIIIIPLFVKQMNSAKNMQLVQPEIRRIQERYKGKTDPASRQKMSEETMAVYKDKNANPFASCLPAILQMPIFFALFRVLNQKIPQAAEAGTSFGPVSAEQAHSLHDASWIFGTDLSSSFLGSDGIGPKVVTGILLIIMMAATFLMQKELTMKNLPPESMQGQAGTTQKMMMYMLPLIYLISGPAIPIGVLVYWATTNVWSFGQQYYMVRNNPTPNSVWERRKEERINKKRVRHGEEPIDFEAERRRKLAEERAKDEAYKRKEVRVQPTGKKRSKNAGGKALTDEEKLKAAREKRAKAEAERRARYEAEHPEAKKPQQQGKKKRKKSGK